MKKYLLTFFVLLTTIISCQSKEDDVNNGGGTQSPTTKTSTTTSTTTPIPPVTPPAVPSLNQTVRYEGTNEVFLNPERGFLTHQDQGESDWTLNADWVRQKRNQEGISLILTIYYMNNFREKDIPEYFLNRIRNNMRVIREGGSKVVLRFAYSKDQGDYYNGRGDTSWYWTERHLNQLAPIIRENADIIAVWEAGFVGVWGEWYYTNHYGFQPQENAGAYEARRKVLAKELSILPKDRMVCVRYPMAKIFTQNINVHTNLTEGNAYNGSDLSRIGFHNDCFLADAPNMGTYPNENYRKYMERETQYVVMGGETCTSPNSFTECSNALREMALYHWSYINMDFHEGTINSWKNRCMDDMKRKLGYRFALNYSKFTGNPVPGGRLQIELELKNEGFASPYNRRDVQIVLVRKGTSEKQVFKLNDDPRRWFAGKTVKVKADITLPQHLSKGLYDIYLNLPDPYQSLAHRPEYSIRLANKGIWEAQTGYNKLNTITIQ